MKAEILTEEMREELDQELMNIYSKFTKAEIMEMLISNNFKEAEDYDDIILAQGQDNDYRIDYIDKNNKETHICLAGMNEIDAEDRFNGMFPGNIFICAKEIVL